MTAADRDAREARFEAAPDAPESWAATVERMGAASTQLNLFEEAA